MNSSARTFQDRRIEHRGIVCRRDHNKHVLGADAVEAIQEVLEGNI